MLFEKKKSGCKIRSKPSLRERLFIYRFQNLAIAAAFAVAVYVVEVYFTQERTDIFGFFAVYADVFEDQPFGAARDVWVEKLFAAGNNGFGTYTHKVRKRKFLAVMREIHVLKCDGAYICAKLKSRENSAHPLKKM